MKEEHKRFILSNIQTLNEFTVSNLLYLSSEAFENHNPDLAKEYEDCLTLVKGLISSLVRIQKRGLL